MSLGPIRFDGTQARPPSISGAGRASAETRPRDGVLPLFRIRPHGSTDIAPFDFPQHSSCLGRRGRTCC
jgi:hypothetical protein